MKAAAKRWWLVILIATGGLILAALELALARTYAAVPPGVYVSDVAFPVVWTIAGLLAWRLRPVSRVGPLMLLLGLFQFANASNGWRLPTDLPLRPAITAAGLSTFWFGLALAGHLLLTYPTGRATNRLDRAYLRVLYISATLISLTQLIVHTPNRSACADRCQVSPIQLVESRQISSAVYSAGSAWYAILAVACVVLILRRATESGSRWRRQRIAIAIASVVAVGGGAAVLTMNAVYRSALHPFAWLLYAVNYLVIVLLPGAFLIGLLRDRLSYSSVADLVRGLDQIDTRDLQAGLAKTLQDPNLTLAFPVGAKGDFVDPDGQPIHPPEDGTRHLTTLGPLDDPVAVLIHDPQLSQSPKLLQAAGAAARLALQNARLHAVVRAQLSEVKSSRARIIAAADDERRRLERNLHDGAQQRLLGIGMTLRLLQSQLDRWADTNPQGAESVNAATTYLHEAERDLRSAIEELRELAQGLHPAILTDEGLPAAVGVLVRRSPIPVRVEAQMETRPPARIEETAYYVVCEALQNVAKHSRARSAVVQLHHTGGHLDLCVSDNGIGGAHAHAGSGLRGLADRAVALDGTCEIRSEPGTGTQVRVRLPCE